MTEIPNQSIDMIFVDLPYGVTTKNKWDNVIPYEPMWKQFERIIKPNGAILLFGQDKFTARTMLSNEELHRYNIIWKKTTPTGFLNAISNTLEFACYSLRKAFEELILSIPIVR